MQSRTESRNIMESDAHNAPPPTMGSQPWWCGVGYGASRTVPPDGLLENTPKQPQVDVLCEHDGTKGKQSSDDSIKESGAGSKEMQDMTTEAGSNGGVEQEPQQMHPTNCPVPPLIGEYFVPHTQLELGHSIACAPYPYPDPYYGSMMAAYGGQPFAPQQYMGMTQTRMALPLEMTEEPVYVNAKQYHGILRRRQSRAKAELEKKLVKVRKPYLHESRHQHAMRRARGCGGRFLNTKKADGSDNNPSTEKGGSSSAGNSMQSASSSGSDHIHSNASGNPKTDTSRQERAEGVCESRTYSSHNGSFQHSGFQFDRGEDGDCSGQQRNDILAKGCRTVTIQ